MKDTVNTYFAVLLITLAGAGGALLIVRVAIADAPLASIVTPRLAPKGTEASYVPLQQKLLTVPR